MSWDSTTETLYNYFSQFGELLECVAIMNHEIGRCRGFGFITFSDPKIVDVIMTSGKNHLLFLINKV